MYILIEKNQEVPCTVYQVLSIPVNYKLECVKRLEFDDKSLLFPNSDR